MSNLVSFLVQMALFSTLCITLLVIFYHLVRWLRERGHGPKLDAFANWHARASRQGTIHALRTLRGIHSMPFYGSRKQRETFDMMLVRVQREADPQQ